MSLAVAIASEQDSFDGEIYRVLLEQLLQRPVSRWSGTFVFNGYKSVAKFSPAFLAAAAAADVKHALLAVDNDGGAKLRPEHRETDEPKEFSLDDGDGCRECWLASAIPARWAARGGISCVVVPVQVVETWLLVLRGDELTPTPEQRYDRPALKKRFFGKPTPPLERRITLACAELSKPNALEVLRARPSFQRFEARLASW